MQGNYHHVIFILSRTRKGLKVIRRTHTLKLMKFMFKCCTESVSMKFVVVLRFLGLICMIHLSGKSRSLSSFLTTV